MTKIKTRDFGEIEVSEENIFNFPVGLPAFETSRNYALIMPRGEGAFPLWLQNLEDISICFIVCDAKSLIPEFAVELSPYEEKMLGIAKNSQSDVTALFIANLTGGLEKATVNMKSPIIINNSTKIASQILLPGTFDFKYPLFKTCNNDEKPSTSVKEIK